MQHIKSFIYHLKKNFKHIDFTIIIIYVILSLTGLTMIYSASMAMGVQESHGDAELYYFGQLRYVIMGFLIIILMTALLSGDMLKNRRLHIFLIIIVFFALLTTHFFGTEVNGERRWLDLPLIGRFQPSEFFKIVVILYLAYIYDRKRVQLSTMKKENFFPLLLVGGISCLVLFNDFGTWLVTVSIIIGMFIYAAPPMKVIVKVIGYVVLALSVLVGIRYLFTGEVLSGYQRARIEAYMHPFLDASGTSYQLTNSLISISHGGVTGTGLGDGIMKLGYLPEPHTDFIFAVIAEELGLIGVLIILLLFMALVFKALYYAHKSTDPFYSLLCVGVAIYVSLQVFINLGGISRLIPLTGIPLPFLSQGGSAFLSISLAVGLLTVAGKRINENNKVED